MTDLTRKVSLFIGRFQPFHEGHKYIINRLLEDGRRVYIGIRATDPGERNPYTMEERRWQIYQEYGDRVQVIELPDIDEVVHGRTPGWQIREVNVPEEVTKISGTEKRNTLKQVIWLTGNSGAGKTTLALELQEAIGGIILDGDAMRKTISLGAGFSMEERLAHNCRVARLARELQRQGYQVIVALIAPTAGIRNAANEICEPYWVWVHREQAARANYPYDEPSTIHGDQAPALFINADRLTPQEEADDVIGCMGGEKE